MDKITIKKLLFEIEQIDKLIEDSKPYFDLCEITEPDFIERCGLAQILQSFYNGLELILLMIIKANGNIQNNGNRWHKALLSKAFEIEEKKPQIFRDELRTVLFDYLKFRHLTRHTYGFQLKWEEMEMLVKNLENTWEIVKSDIKGFIKNVSGENT